MCTETISTIAAHSGDITRLNKVWFRLRLLKSFCNQAGICTYAKKPFYLFKHFIASPLVTLIGFQYIDTNQEIVVTKHLNYF